MNTLRYMKVVSVCSAMFLGIALVAGMNAVSEENREMSATTEAEAPPTESASVLAGMTVDVMLKAVNASARETFRGKVADVVTGSIIILERNGTAMKARLYGVDCPEAGQAYYHESTQFAADKFLNESVNVSVFTTDSQQNPVVLVFNTSGESLSHLLVAAGMGWWDRPNTAKDALLRRLNADAIMNGIGLYADPTALAPWDYRDSHGMAQFTYTLGDEAVAESPKAALKPSAEEKPRAISAKGTMTEDVPRTPVTIPKGIEKDIDVMGLMGKHQPHIATDESGKTLGLTANNISQIPFATEFGLRDGDIISNVNGIPVESIPQIMQMAPQFEGVKQFQVEVIRNGQRTTIPISIN